jgi:undecaprenyl-diphosphatase
MSIPFDMEIAAFFANYSNPSLDISFQIISFFGSLMFMIILVIAFWMAKKRKFALTFLTALISTNILVYLLKIFIDRSRPLVYFEMIYLNILNTPSFPSAHAANIFLFTVLLTFFNKKYWFTILGALLVAFSRIYLGAHFLSDVLTGAIIGTIFAFIFYINRDNITTWIKKTFSLKKL